MIKSLVLKNWRSYADAAFEFEPGTTFVVASNGVGKTSLVEAARWALFGISTAGDHTAVRVGESNAMATVELQLPDRTILTVERRLSSKPRAALSVPIVRLNGETLAPEDLPQLLHSFYRTDPAFLAGLTMPSRKQNHAKPLDGDLEAHLGRYYGIDTLRSALARLEKDQKTTAARIKGIKLAHSSTAERLLELESAVEQAEQRITACTDRHHVLQARLEIARSKHHFDTEMRLWQDRKTSWNAAVEKLIGAISNDLGQSFSVENIAQELEDELARLSERIGQVQVDIAVCTEKERALTLNQQRLDSAHDDCPVCRRPLDSATVDAAHKSNQHDREDLARRLGPLRSTKAEFMARHDRLRAIKDALARIPPPGAPPQPPQLPEESSTLDELTTVAEDGLVALVDARTDHQQATSRLDEARTADLAMRELESLFTREAKIKILAETTEATLSELLDDTIRPLAAEINQRWKRLFPDRGDLDTYSNGNLTRTVNGHALPFDAFSTGEGMTATILMRLLVAELVTTTNFCWFDEPLEHLDPDVRRKVASILSRVTNGEGPIKQVVVTTYEERLARHLIARDEHHVRLVDVRRK
ncbi:AAA family ATPase [Nocardia pseudovaccinii]|uniref:AAA family ATPase n=1 Tax=Nocardia pseudovaccinii TaxID=189540 RepID=UPI003D8DD515